MDHGQSGQLVANAVTARAAKGVSQREGDGTLLVANTVTASAGHHGRSSPRGDGSDNIEWIGRRFHDR